ncbi:Peroxisome biogenesis protein 6 [Acorus calamus]|uniref:Peroxisomal ATPase PEX6 n=1 Tax=Acorus calamus TaxID=4465 RepID=A0AAV9E2J9_ACOCL|nr:Peroxisome biogenesis protein 6 [Acorus calamus]
MVVGRRTRRPLILSPFKTPINDQDRPSDGQGCPSQLRLTAGILRRSSDDGVGVEGEPDEASQLVGVSVAVLKKLSIVSGSLVLIKNVETNVGRIGKVFVLERPATASQKCKDELGLSSSQLSREMGIFPSYAYSPDNKLPCNQEVAYISPLLAFNLGLHTSCLKGLIHGGEEALKYLFEDGEHDTEGSAIKADSSVCVELLSWSHLPDFASHLRVSFVKIPECSVLGSLKGSSMVETEDRQALIDSALHDYFKPDRFLVRGDVFFVNIKWNCNSEMCLACTQNTLTNSSNNRIYFKVMAMEPLKEPILRANCERTALVLGGSAASAIPPDNLIRGPTRFMPLQKDTVKILASVLTPPLCPSALSSKFRVSVLIDGPRGCGKRTIIRHVTQRLGLHVVEYSCHDLMSSSERKSSVALAQTFDMAHRYSPSVLLLRHFDVFTKLSSNEGSPTDQVGISSEVASVIREYTNPISEDEDSYSGGSASDCFVLQSERMNCHQILLIATADSPEGLPLSIRRCFSHEISMKPLNETQRDEMMSESLHSVWNVHSFAGTREFLKDIVGQTSGFMPRDIRALIADASANFMPRFSKDGANSKIRRCDDRSSIGSEILIDSNSSCKAVAQKAVAQNLAKEDFSVALERSKKRSASALGTPKVPNVKWEDVGGLEDVKKSILDTVQLPLLHKDLFSSGLRKRSGVLLYGPPGTGKTLLAKAVATECSLNFLSVKGPELINMYIGESEKNVRDIFQKARSARPCVIFFDELDSLAPARGASGDSGGVMDRVVSQMLAEIDGLNDSSQDLFIIGASNRPDLIDPALLRPGRFDKLLYVGVNSDTSYNERVLAALTRKFKLDENVSLLSIAKKCPPNFTGADMYALCADAWFNAAKRKVTFLHSDSSSKGDQADSVVVEHEDFIKVLGELSPSLSLDELKKYERLRDQFEGTSK